MKTAERPKKELSEEDKEKRREYWKMKKRESRERMTSQKRRRVKEYDRARSNVRKKKEDLTKSHSTFSPAARRMATSHVKCKMPNYCSCYHIQQCLEIQV